jgi:hypothetical protein
MAITAIQALAQVNLPTSTQPATAPALAPMSAPMHTESAQAVQASMFESMMAQNNMTFEETAMQRMQFPNSSDDED